jgi:hypothetical protein
MTEKAVQIKEEAVLIDIILQEDYLKIITDAGNFSCINDGEKSERLILKALKLVGKQVEIFFASSKLAFEGIFYNVELVSQNIPSQSLPLNRRFSNKVSKKIFGPPGTGKTTKLIGFVQRAIERGVKPQDIAFISFSNGAATVATKRVSEAFPNLGSIAFPHFSTMHSLATKIGSAEGKKLMVEEHFTAFDRRISCWKDYTELGNPFSGVERYYHPVLNEHSLSVAEQRRPDFSLDNLKETERELLLKALKDRFPDMLDDSLTALCQAYMQSFMEFKREKGLISFDDVIEAVVSPSFPANLIPTFELLIIDEAQDLTSHLWVLARKLIDVAKEVYVAGDDDQAIMMGIGASPLTFVKLPTTEPDEPLKNSYRIPAVLRSYVDAGVMPELEKLPNRVGVPWKSNEEKGGYLNSGSSSVKNENGKRYLINREFTPQALLSRVKGDYFKMAPQTVGQEVLIEDAKTLLEKTLFVNKLYHKETVQLTERATNEFGCSSSRELLIAIGAGEVSPSDVVRLSFPETEIRELEKHHFPSPKTGIPDWLILAPTKATGEKLSEALKDQNVPHFYRNKPVLNADKELSLIRVQTVHMSKGDEALNSAVVAMGFGDIAMLANDPRLAYVAVTRSSHSCYPRVIREGLLGDMLGSKNIEWPAAARKYHKMFPIMPMSKV